MKLNQVAAQLYTLRDHCKTPDDIARTFEKVRAIGYEAVQASALGPIENEKLLQLAKDNGLVICATHEGIKDLFETPEAIIEKLQALECKHTALGFPSGVNLGSSEGVLEFARKMDEAAQKFVAAGLTLSHHNHQHEFRKLGDKTVMDVLLENTQAVSLELDTYWVQFGGANPESWCRKANGRLPLLHLKDYGLSEDAQPIYTEIGNGTLEFPAIIAAAEASGCEWFIVEQDTTPGDPFDSLQISYNYIKNNLVA